MYIDAAHGLKMCASKINKKYVTFFLSLLLDLCSTPKKKGMLFIFLSKIRLEIEFDPVLCFAITQLGILFCRINTAHTSMNSFHLQSMINVCPSAKLIIISLEYINVIFDITYI